MIHNLRIATWNANGLTERRQELEVFLKTERIDVALISETRFSDKTYFQLKNYTIHTTNHPSGNTHGGAAVIIKENIKHYVLNEYKTEKIQATSVRVQNKHGETTLSAIYCPPRHIISTDDFKMFFSTLDNRFVCGGDWNAKHCYWGSRLTLPRGRQLYKTVTDLDLSCMSHGEPTYWPTDRNKKPDLLDFFILKNIPRTHLSIETCTDLSSDHTPVILNVSARVILTEIPTRIYNRSTNWDKYGQYITNNLNLNISLKTPDEVEETVEYLNRLIHNAAHDSTVKNKRYTQPLHQYPKFLRDKIATRRNLRKVWHNTGYPSDKTAFNNASQELKHLIKAMNDEHLQSYLRELKPNSDSNYSLWKATSKIKKPTAPVPPIKMPTGKWARSDSEKASVYAEHLRTVFEPFPSQNAEHDQEVTKYLHSPLQMCLPLKSTCPREIISEIKNLKDKKAPGYDEIDATLLKQLPKKGIMLVVILFNACLRLQYYPSQWKIAQVVMVPKAGKPPHEADSYRPISLLPVIGKLFEKIILNRIKPHLQDILPEHQFGFREKHGTIEQVHRLVEVINNTFENKQYCSTIFLDIGQAFDKVWHDGLKYKIKKMLPHCFYGIMNSYVTKRSFEVRYKSETSKMYAINSGVPQGSILGPILYLIFTADLPTNDKVVTATYADDTAIMSVNENAQTASQNLQEHLNNVEKWFNKWRIKANQNKSKHITFTLRRQTCPPITLHNETIPQADDAKYLGMHLDRRLTWQKHIWTKRKQLDTKVRQLYWLIGPKSQLSSLSKMTIYKTVLKPIWTYGIQLWGTASNSNIDILERFQSKTLRTMFNIPYNIRNKYIHMDLNINTVKEEVTAYSIKYQKRLSIHTNNLAYKLGGTGGVHFSRLKRQSVLSLETRFLISD
uniref:Reverse transcriptase domain-containing protein n=1 Tax=Heliothis virescens TaxID=7102 RepID=A0A2A4IUM2_HELVI